MPYKDPKKRAEWQLNYYHTHPEVKEKQAKLFRLKYWRNKFMKTFACSLADCEKFTADEMKEQIENGMCKV